MSTTPNFRSGIRALKNGWMAFARVLGWFNTLLLLTLVYILFIGLPAIVLKLIRKDLLDRRFRDRSSYWRAKDSIERTLEQAKHQF